jgi:tRNA(Ile)-lysidine synthase TilS/MesJ
MLAFSRPEIEDILSKVGIPAFLEPCPYAKERPKRVLFKFLSTLPEGQIKNLTNHNTFKAMLSVLKEKVENYDEALKKIKETSYSELLF